MAKAQQQNTPEKVAKTAKKRTVKADMVDKRTLTLPSITSLSHSPI
jgi:hypothetical protein